MHMIILSAWKVTKEGNTRELRVVYGFESFWEFFNKDLKLIFGFLNKRVFRATTCMSDPGQHIVRVKYFSLIKSSQNANDFKAYYVHQDFECFIKRQVRSLK